MIKKYTEFLNEKITNNNNFKNWFSDSKVVDNNGNPLIVYHGSTDNITTFNADFGGSNTGNNQIGGFYFTNMYEVAEDYGRQSYVRKNIYGDRDVSVEELETQAQNDEHINIISVYLRMENPLYLRSEDGYVDIEKTDKYIEFIKTHETNHQEVYEFFDEKGWYSEDEIESYRDDIIELAKKEMGIDEVEEIDFEEAIENYANYYTGSIEKKYPEYDGIIWENVYDNISNASAFIQNVYIVIEPTQIKSATNNNGNFNINSKNINESNG